MFKIPTICLFLLLLFTAAYNNRHNIYVVIGENANKTEQLTAYHLKTDLEKVLGFPVQLMNEKEGFPRSGLILLIGTPVSNSVIASLAQKETNVLSGDYPGSRGGIWATVNHNEQKIAVLAGSDVHGMQYAAEDTSVW